MGMMLDDNWPAELTRSITEAPITPELLFLSELRQICGVKQNAISNWISRFPDFPQPLHEAGRQAVYDRNEIHEWLERHGKQANW